MADINVLDLTPTTPGSNDSMILFDRTTGEGKSTRFDTLTSQVLDSKFGDSSPTAGQELSYDATTGKYKNTSQIASLNEALTNEVTTRVTNGAHNLLPNTASDRVLYGITFTVNPNKSITVTGQKSDGSGHSLDICVSFLLYKGTYILTDGLSNTDSLDIFLSDGQTIIATTRNSEHKSEFTLDSDTICSAVLEFRGAQGTQFNTIIYPMIRLASDTDPIYQPYAKTNRELTESVTNVSKIGASSISDFFTVSSDVAQVYDSSFIVKNGNMINIYLSIKLSASLGSSIASLGNIAAGLRPYGAFYDIASKWNGDAITPVPLHVRTDGVIRLLNAVANTDYSFNIVYLI